MSAENAYFVDRHPEESTYIRFSILEYAPETVSIALRIGKDYIESYRSLIVWKPTGRVLDVQAHDPPFIPHCDPSRQLVPENVEEIKLLHDEAVLTNSYEILEDNIIHITLFEYYKGWNISLQDSEPNRWVVYRKFVYPNFEDTVIRRFEKEVLRD